MLFLAEDQEDDPITEDGVESALETWRVNELDTHG
jgi:hypothetical protein